MAIRDIIISIHASAIWFLVGCACAFLAPKYLLSEETAKDKVDLIMVIGSLSMIISYSLGFSLRSHPIMRVRGPLWVAQICTGTVTFISAILAIAHDFSARAIVGQIFMAVSVFCLMEIARPTCDYGLLQLFIRLPVQSSATAFFRKNVGGWEMVLLTVVLWEFFNFWNGLTIKIFEEAEEQKRRVEEALRLIAPGGNGRNVNELEHGNCGRRGQGGGGRGANAGRSR